MAHGRTRMTLKGIPANYKMKAPIMVGAVVLLMPTVGTVRTILYLSLWCVYHLLTISHNTLNPLFTRVVIIRRLLESGGSRGSQNRSIREPGSSDIKGSARDPV